MTAANGPRRSRKRIHRSARLPCQPSLSHPAKAIPVIQRAFCLTAAVSVAGKYSRVHTRSPPSSRRRLKTPRPPSAERKSVVEGRGGSVHVGPGGRRHIKQKKTN